MRACTCMTGPHPERQAAGEPGVVPVLLSVVLLVAEGSRGLEGRVASLAELLASLHPSLVSEHELIVVGDGGGGGLGEATHGVLQRLVSGAGPGELRVLFDLLCGLADGHVAYGVPG